MSKPSQETINGYFQAAQKYSEIAVMAAYEGKKARRNIPQHIQQALNHEFRNERLMANVKGYEEVLPSREFEKQNRVAVWIMSAFLVGVLVGYVVTVLITVAS